MAIRSLKRRIEALEARVKKTIMDIPLPELTRTEDWEVLAKAKEEGVPPDVLAVMQIILYNLETVEKEYNITPAPPPGYDPLPKENDMEPG